MGPLWGGEGGQMCLGSNHSQIYLYICMSNLVGVRRSCRKKGGVQTDRPARTHAHTHARTHARRHTHTQTHTHTHTHRHTQKNTANLYSRTTKDRHTPPLRDSVNIHLACGEFRNGDFVLVRVEDNHVRFVITEFHHGALRCFNRSMWLAEHVESDAGLLLCRCQLDS